MKKVRLNRFYGLFNSILSIGILAVFIRGIPLWAWLIAGVVMFIFAEILFKLLKQED